ncbi:hypothetical protein V6N13_122460 [Hibiscus sabdariffa]|uniref:Uncharacterized protein n=1 Tax=Hibiscus sabdariffa TaxID=183260 RepID=A0ABR2Q794_9ROSI
MIALKLEDRTSQAKSSASDMHSKLVSCSVVSFFELEDKLINKVRMEKMKLLFRTIRRLFECYDISKNVFAAFKIFREDRSLCSHKTKFNLMFLYSSLSRTSTKSRRNSDALGVLDGISLNGICPDN